MGPMFVQAKFRSISTKIVLSTLLFSIVAIIITTLVHLKWQYQEGETRIDDRLEQIKTGQMDSIASSLWDVDESKLMIQMKGILALPDVEKVEIKATDGHYEVGAIKSKSTVIKKIPLIYKDPVELTTKRTLGTMEVTMGLDPLKARLYSMGRSILITQALQVLLLGSFVLLLMHFLVTKHLKKISSYVQNLNIEELQGHMTLDRKSVVVDEFSIVTDSINQMTEKLGHHTNHLQELIDDKTKDISSIMHTIKQGIFTISPDIKVNPEYSNYLEDILETKNIAGRDVMGLLFSHTNLSSDTMGQVLSALVASIGEESFAYDMNEDLLVREIHKKLPSGATKILELDWVAVINENDITEKIMVTVRNVTELRQLKAIAEEKKRELDMIGEILSLSPDRFQEFIETAQNLIQENRELLLHQPRPSEDVALTLFRNLHTLKGLARSYGFIHLAAPVHDCEQIFENYSREVVIAVAVKSPVQSGTHQQMMLLEELSKIGRFIDEYIHINSKKLGRSLGIQHAQLTNIKLATEMKWINQEEIQRTLQQLAELDISNFHPVQKSLWKKVRITLSLLGTDKCEHILGSLLESLPSIAKDLGKLAPKVIIQDQGIFIKNEHHTFLRHIFTHILRNSMDHGIEPGPERKVKGKDPQGQIEFFLFTEKNSFIIGYRDDGKGINIKALKNKAIELGLIKINTVMSDEEVAMLIFHPGMTTARNLTEISGRGMGMDAVKKSLEKVMGKIRLRLLAGPIKDEGYRPFEIFIILPKSVVVEIV